MLRTHVRVLALLLGLRPPRKHSFVPRQGTRYFAGTSCTSAATELQGAYRDNRTTLVAFEVGDFRAYVSSGLP